MGARGPVRPRAGFRSHQQRRRHPVGFHDVQATLDFVENDLISERRITLAAKRCSRHVFRMGFFEDPYADVTHTNAA